jgi:hypothetical protein
MPLIYIRIKSSHRAQGHENKLFNTSCQGTPVGIIEMFLSHKVYYELIGFKFEPFKSINFLLATKIDLLLLIHLFLF